VLLFDEVFRERVLAMPKLADALLVAAKAGGGVRLLVEVACSILFPLLLPNAVPFAITAKLSDTQVADRDIEGVGSMLPRASRKSQVVGDDSDAAYRRAREVVAVCADQLTASNLGALDNPVAARRWVSLPWRGGGGNLDPSQLNRHIFLGTLVDALSREGSSNAEAILAYAANGLLDSDPKVQSTIEAAARDGRLGAAGRVVLNALAGKHS
jgi:hypothetical protein